MKTWTEALGEEKQKAYFQQILQYVHNERLAGKV
ncbi:TPA: uracil-DNA glycosylase, partial [Mannheimia haemolytica]|nr:uracil-DNA glycosylase [Mannheimia haemolytica]